MNKGDVLEEISVWLSDEVIRMMLDEPSNDPYEKGKLDGYSRILQRIDAYYGGLP